MLRIKLWLALLMTMGAATVLVKPAEAQVSNPTIIWVTADPSGACSNLAPLRYNYTNTTLWGCTSSVWTQIAGGGASGVSSFTGDGNLLSNSGSTGAVTATLATAAAHKVWMNNTGSTATPGYQSVGTADLPTALANQTSLRGNAMAAAAGDATIGQVIAHGAKALDFASTATGACATVITDTATGALSTDTVIFNANASIKAVTGFVPAATGGFSIAAFPSADTISFEACNWTAGTVDPGSITVNWKVIR